jgi:CRP-like cAMP-binding protein
LLAKLPRRYREQFIDACEMVELELADVLCRPEANITHVYFPTRSFISQITPGDCAGLEVAMVGDEGMFGVPLGLGVRISPVTAVVQGAGTALRMGARAFQAQLAKSTELRKHLGVYTYVHMSQIAQTAACNRFHRVEQRLARWLLMTSDRAHSLAFKVTHAFLAFMLGVRRVGVTTAAVQLQARGLIRYSRGNLLILDRKGLEQVSCSCYRAQIRIYEKMMG